MSLSDAVIKLTDGSEDNWMSCILRDNVKKFIKELKTQIEIQPPRPGTTMITTDTVQEIIDKLVGKDLL